MARKAVVIALDKEERQVLESWVRSGTTEQRYAQRARIVLESAAGEANKEIARTLNLGSVTVGKWRSRFRQSGLAGLRDAPRPGVGRRYDEIGRASCRERV